MVESETLKNLREFVPQKTKHVQLEAVMTVVELVCDGNTSVGAIAKASGLDEDGVIKLVLDLGTWLGQSINAGRGAVVYEHSLAPGEIVEDQDGVEGQMSLFKAHTDEYVVLPPGMETAKVGRDMSKSVAQIVRGAPDEAMLRRWLLRKHHSIRQVLGFEIVAGVHRFAQVGRLADLEELVVRREGNPELARLLVEAYDLLDVARGDALDALDALASRDDLDLDAVETLVARASWLAEASFGRIQRRIDLVRGGAGEVVDVLNAVVRLAASSASVFRPASDGALSDGQVRCQVPKAGLDLEGVTHKEVETVRSWVSDADLTADADLLISDGVRALRAGCGELFRESLQKRAAGDLAWAQDLNEKLEAVTTV